MKTLLGVIIIALFGLSAGLPAQGITVSEHDIVCGFKYKIGDGSTNSNNANRASVASNQEQGETSEREVSNDGWTRGKAAGTTRHAARQSRDTALSMLESQAAASGQSFESQHLGCRDPFGHN
ncbi:MAG: hypothetical protein SWJ54_10410 [Cyanobacteriota bacterium]|nr:hypothetical protein [Cyanobacteriota bacterium]